MAVSISGSTTKDQVCGLKVVAALAVPGRIPDIGSFKDAIKAAAAANAAGAEVVVEITTFKQTIANTASCPGTASDYENAREQFKAGVIAAAGGGEVTNLCIDGGCSASGRRQLNRRRRLQTVEITYDIVVDDPQIAGAVAAATSDTASFADNLAVAINEAGNGAANSLELAPDDITVSEPTVQTEVEYEVVVQTTNINAVQDVSTGLTSPTELAAALQTAVDTGDVSLVIDSNSLQAEVVCSRPIAAGYVYTETDLSASAADFDVTVRCAPGYKSSGSEPTATVCDQGGEAFHLDGACEAIACAPTSQVGYVVTAEDSLTVVAFDITATCDTAAGYEGTAVASACEVDGENYVLSGCRAIVCERPASAVGYEFVETNLDLSAGDFDVAVTCTTAPSAEYPGAFTGTPVVTPCTESGEYGVTGCVQAPVCAPTSQVGYVVTAEDSLTVVAFDITATCDTAAGYEGTAVASPCEVDGENYVLSGCTLPTSTPSEDEGGSAGVVIGIILGIVAVAVIGIFGVKAMKSKGGAETTGARPSMLSPSAAAYQTDDVDPEDNTTSTRPGRKLSF
jgi:hypothetical protein